MKQLFLREWGKWQVKQNNGHIFSLFREVSKYTSSKKENVNIATKGCSVAKIKSHD